MSDTETPTPSSPNRGVARKGYATPKRAEAEAVHKRPLISADPKAAKKADRTAQREQRMKEQKALSTGDEANLPPRFQGPVNRFVRDSVDSRTGVSQFLFILIPVVLAQVLLFPLLPGIAAQAPMLQQIGTLAVWLGMILCVADALLLANRVRKGVIERFGIDKARGVRMLTLSRALMPRRLRTPKAMVKPGEDPR